MKKLIFPFLLTMAFVLSGCNQSKVESSSHVKATTHTVVKSTTAYQSITQYHSMITGQNLKTGVLKITREGNVLTFNMDYKLSDKLKNTMLNTKNKFYLTFTEVDGYHKMDGFFPENPEMVVGNPEASHLTQTMKLKTKATPEEIKTAMTPANYELVFLNENYQKVAVVIGLDLSTINP